MKRILRVAGLLVATLLGVLAVIWCIAWAVATTKSKRAASVPWPADLGTLAAFPSRFPSREGNAGAARLTELAMPLGIDFRRRPPKRPPDSARTAIQDYVTQELTRAENTIAEPPAEVLAYLDERSRGLDAVRDHLLRGEAIRWPIDLTKGFDAPMPNLLAHMELTRVLAARALVSARRGDAAAWDDLQAAWRLNRPMHTRPEMISQLVALATARTVNGVAWKMPPPAPRWLEAMRAVDHDHFLLGSLQHDAWVFHVHSEGTLKLGGKVGLPYIRLGIADLANHYRETATLIEQVDTCAFDGKPFFEERLAAIPRWNVLARIGFPDVSAMWQRAFRYNAEREATANALRIAAGETAVTESQCSDGHWTAVERPDGAVQLSFSREVPKSSAQENVMPLSLVIAR